MSTSNISAWLVTMANSIAVLQSRIYPDQAPKESPNPCLVYQHIGFEAERELAGGVSDVGEHVYQLRAYADTRLQADTIREALRQMFDGLTGYSAAFGKIDSNFAPQSQTIDDETGDYGSTGLLIIYTH